LVTGRELEDLLPLIPNPALFDRIVAENGAVLYDPATNAKRLLAIAPSEALVAELRRRKVAPLSVGHSIIATWEPNQTLVLEAVHTLGLEVQIVFNKGAVMVLPPGANKASGLGAALAELGISAHNTVAVGDAENDHAFLRACGCAVAVANALPAIQESVDFVTKGARGAGVVELVERICKDNSKIAAMRGLGLAVGKTPDGEPVLLNLQAGGVLIAGQSGVGKSTIATALTERMVENSLQFCVLDPEGDYDSLGQAVCIGDAKSPPTIEQALTLLRRLDTNVVVNTLGIRLEDRPGFFLELLQGIVRQRRRTARPHWMLIDEAHHVLPSEHRDLGEALPDILPGAVFITVHPEAMSRDALRMIQTVIAVGDNAPKAITQFCQALEETPPVNMPPPELGQVMLWRRGEFKVAYVVATRSEQARKRHTRKYAEGELGKENSFYFRGPEGKLNLRAGNLMTFIQLAEGLDNATWEFHLRSHDYSSWFRGAIKDEGLADEAKKIEDDRELAPSQSQAQIADLIRQRYTKPVTSEK
jgi:hydroxymethylpyrimidine pyrophosphatase-like HAD family hydrolase